VIGALIGSLQKTLAANAASYGVAIKLKRQCDSTIGKRFTSGIDHDGNGERWLVEQVAPHTRLFIDVGANVGEWSVMFAAVAPAAHGLLFEPAPDTLARLRRNLAGAGLDRLEVFGCALADEAGEADFFAEPNQGETSSLLSGHANAAAQKIRVQVATLDDVLDARGVTDVDMLKIDAEGFDMRVMLGARRLIGERRCKVIQFEYNHPWMAAGATLTAAYALLEGAGYQVRLLKADGLHRLDPRVTGEYFRYSNFVAYLPGPVAERLEARPHLTIS